MRRGAFFSSLNDCDHLKCLFVSASDGGVTGFLTAALEDFKGSTKCHQIEARTHMDSNKLVLTRYGMTSELEFSKFIQDKVWQSQDIWNSTRILRYTFKVIGN